MPPLKVENCILKWVILMNHLLHGSWPNLKSVLRKVQNDLRHHRHFISEFDWLIWNLLCPVFRCVKNSSVWRKSSLKNAQYWARCGSARPSLPKLCSTTFTMKWNQPPRVHNLATVFAAVSKESTSKFEAKSAQDARKGQLRCSLLAREEMWK